VYFFFDESGSFAVPRDGATHRAAVIVSIAVPDHVIPILRRRFLDFASTLEKNERENGEPKGARLCITHQLAFGDMLRRLRTSIILTPVTLDLSILSGSEYASLGSGMADAIRDWIPRMLHDGPKDRLDLLARQASNLSDNQTLRAFALAYCFKKTLDHAVMFLSHGEFERSWNDLHFVVDRVHTQPASREEQVFSILVLSWLAAWSESDPIALIREIHTPGHTLVRKYSGEGGLDLGLILRDRIEWHDSRSNWGLQVADMAAAIIGKAVQNPASGAAAKPFVKVMRASCLTPARALNVFSPDLNTATDYVEKYQPLVDAMIADRDRRRR
jgi:hypothetical protein